MFGGDDGGSAGGFSKQKALGVLQNVLEKEGLLASGEAGTTTTTPPAGGKHWHRVMVLYDEFLTQYCERAAGDVDRVAAAEARTDGILDLLAQREISLRRLEEARDAVTRAQDAARSEAETRARDAERALEEARRELAEVKGELEDVRGELRFVRGEWEEIEQALEDINVRLAAADEAGRRELEALRAEAGAVTERARGEESEGRIGSLEAKKAVLVGLFCALALAVALAWMYL